MKEKSLHNSNVNGAKKNVADLVVYGNGDLFKLLCKASSEDEGWMKSTKVMEVVGSTVPRKKPTMDELEQILNAGEDPGIDLLPNSEVVSKQHALGCLVQVTTQQRNKDGSYAVAEALTFVPGATFASFDFPENA